MLAQSKMLLKRPNKQILVRFPGHQVQSHLENGIPTTIGVSGTPADCVSFFGIVIAVLVVSRNITVEAFNLRFVFYLVEQAGFIVTILTE